MIAHILKGIDGRVIVRLEVKTEEEKELLWKLQDERKHPLVLPDGGSHPGHQSSITLVQSVREMKEIP